MKTPVGAPVQRQAGGIRELFRVVVALTALLYGFWVAGNALLHSSWFFVWVGAAVMVCAFTTLGPSGRERIGGWASKLRKPPSPPPPGR